jgi:signal transduction histidine kinase
VNDSPSSSQPAGLSPETAAGGRAAVPPGIGGHVWRALRGQAPLSRIALLLALLLLLVVWLAVAAALQIKRQDALRAEWRQNGNLAGVLAEQTLRVVQGADQSLIRLADLWQQRAVTPADLPRLAAETGLAPHILVQLSLVDAQGRFVGSNLDPDGRKTGAVDLSAREHVRVHLQPLAGPSPRVAPKPAAGGLFIGRPVLGKVSGRWTIQLSRRVNGPDGRTAGVVVASLDPAYFEQLYQQVALGRTGGVALLGADRTLRAQAVGGRAEGMGSTLLPAAGLAELLASPLRQTELDLHGDATALLVSSQRVADYPLHVLVFSGHDEALGEWRQTRHLLLLLALLLSAVVVTTALVFVIGLRRLERTNRALRLSESRAQAANQAKSEFLAAVSHELRTPLTSIRGFAELLQLRLDQPQLREQAGLIRKGAEHLNGLLNEILDLAKVEAGAMVMHPQPVDPVALVRGTVDFYTLAAEAKGLQLQLSLGPDLPAQIVSDPLRIRQVLNNLMSNALKFTPDGGVLLRLRCEDGRLLFEVEDTGPGIGEGLQELVFERFRQGSGDIAVQHGGTGLGLALARAVAGVLGGTLTLRSRPGEGACFTLALPFGPDATAAAGGPRHVPRVG